MTDWQSATRSFSAKYAARCVLCTRRITVGERMVRVYRHLGSFSTGDFRTSEGYGHESCYRTAGGQSFSPKNDWGNLP